MPYQRYNSGQGYDPSPQEADWLGGMAYNPYSKGTDFGFALRNTLNNLLAHKQGQAQANKEQVLVDEEQRRYEAKVRGEAAKAARESQLADKKLALEEARINKPTSPPPAIVGAKALMESDPVTYPNLGVALPEYFKMQKQAAPPETLDVFAKKEDIKAKARARSQVKPQPNSTQLRYTEIDKAVEAGYMSPEEGAMAKIKVSKDDDDVRKGAAIRQANEKAVADVFNSAQNPEKEAKKSVIQSGGANPFTTEGYRMDMPRRYSIAKKNITDGVATGEDNKTVEKYDAMHGYFISKIKDRYKSFDDWMKTSPNARRPEFDKDQIKKWFDIYVR